MPLALKSCCVQTEWTLRGHTTLPEENTEQCRASDGLPRFHSTHKNLLATLSRMAANEEHFECFQLTSPPALPDDGTGLAR